MPKIGFIGSGPVGTAFGVNLSQRGYQIIGVFDVVKEAAQQFAADVPGCQAFEKEQELADSAGMVFITTPDDIIPKVAAEVSWRAGQSVIHCSGASTVHSLDAAREQGAMVGSIHPCQTFAGREQAIRNLPGSTFAIEAEEPLKTTLTEIARALDGDLVYLTSEDKALYHAAACIACRPLAELRQVNCGGDQGLYPPFTGLGEQYRQHWLPRLPHRAHRPGRHQDDTAASCRAGEIRPGYIAPL